MTYYMSVERKEGQKNIIGPYVGDQLGIAKALVEARFKTRTKYLLPTVSIAVMQNGKIIDVFYGDRWHSEVAQ